MLNLLAFKKSMFSGVLDGGQDEVFMGGTRLTRFMESVEKATETIPEAMPPAREGSNVSATGEGTVGSDTVVADDESVPVDEAWGEVLTAGAALLEKLGRALEAGTAQKGGSAASARGGLVARDEKSGEPYLKVPVPRPENLKRIIELLAGLAK